MKAIPLPAKSTPSPVLATAVSKELRAADAEIWAIEKQDFGLLFRATINLRQVRVLIPSKPASTPPNERNSLLHVIVDIDGLRAWLKLTSAL